MDLVGVRMNSRDLSEAVVERLGGEESVPHVELEDGAIGIDMHSIIVAVLRELENQNLLTVSLYRKSEKEEE